MAVTSDRAARARILVVGSGPAGISTALWLRSYGLPFDWIAADAALGGTLRRVGNPIANYPGVHAPDGPTLVGHMARQLARYALAPRAPHRLTHLRLGARTIEATLDDATTHAVDHLVLCTGTRPRLLGLDGEQALLGRGVEISVSRNLGRYAGKEVAIVGGGDAALEGALLLAPHAAQVHLVHRGERFGGQRRFVDAVGADPRIRLHLGRRVTAMRVGGGQLTGIILDNGHQIGCQGLFERIGVEPVLVDGIPRSMCDTRGYLHVEPDGRTSHPALLAAGDVTGSQHQSVAWACGMGARAASTILAAIG